MVYMEYMVLNLTAKFDSIRLVEQLKHIDVYATTTIRSKTSYEVYSKLHLHKKSTGDCSN